MSLLQPLSLPLSLDACGGKAYNLAVMMSSPVLARHVPHAEFVSTAIQKTYLTSIATDIIECSDDIILRLANETALRQIRQCVLDLALREEHARELADFVSKYTVSQRLAVRSSGVSEDGHTASFAGQYDSVLNVPCDVNSIWDAIKAVWASQFSAHVLQYFAALQTGEEGKPMRLPGLAVVVQHQIQPVCSGVAFAVAPTGITERCCTWVAEGVWGLGEGLVSGEISPHTFQIDAGEGVMVITSQRTPVQSTKYACRPEGGTEIIATTAEEQTSSPLMIPSLLEQLGCVVADVSRLKGAPQDVEWCWAEGTLFLVQTRPITRYTFTKHMPTLRLVLANKSHLLDESIVADGYRQFLLDRFGPLEYTPALHAIRITFAGVSTAEGSLNRCFHRSLLRLDQRPTSSTSDMLLNPSQAGRWRFTASNVHFGASAERSACHELTVFRLSHGKDLEQVARLQGKGCLLIVASSADVVSPRQLKSALGTHEGPAFYLVTTDALEEALSATSLADIEILPTYIHYNVGRAYAAGDLQTPARLADWRLSNPEVMYTELNAAHVDYKETLPELEGLYARCVRSTVGLETELFTHSVDVEFLVNTMRRYRDACARSWSVGFHASNCEAEYEAALADAMPHIEDEVDPQHLLTGLTSNNALEMLKAMSYRHVDTWASVLPGASTAESFCTAARGLIKRHLSNPSELSTAENEFAEELYTYLTHYGWMADSDEDFATVHWCEEPSFPLTILFELLQCRNPPVPPPTLSQPHNPLLRRASSLASDELYEKATERLSYLIPASHALWNALHEMRRSLRLKEQVHVQYVRIGLALKLALSVFFREAGVVSDMVSLDDCFHVTMDHLLLFLHGNMSLQQFRACALTYSRQAGMWNTTDSPSKLPVETLGAAAASSTVIMPAVLAETTITGLACSAGSGPVLGPARIIKTLADAKRVRKGDILVTSVTSPAWSPLFSLLTGLVLEEGGMLSHGAVVARECGIPAVSQVSNAMRTFVDGQLLYVDGSTGSVIAYEQICES